MTENYQSSFLSQRERTPTLTSLALYFNSAVIFSKNVITGSDSGTGSGRCKMMPEPPDYRIRFSGLQSLNIIMYHCTCTNTSGFLFIDTSYKVNFNYNVNF